MLNIWPNGLIHQLRWDENENSPAWHHKELTSDAGAPLVFFEVRANVHYATGTQHVVYLGLNDQGLLDNQVHDLCGRQQRVESYQFDHRDRRRRTIGAHHSDRV